MIAENIQEDIDRPGADWYTIKESLKYLHKRYPTLTLDTLYHRIRRSENIPFMKKKQYFLHKDTLDTIEFFKQKEPKRPYRTLKKIEPVEVHTAEDLQSLVEKYGPLVDDEALLNLLEQKYHHRYTVGAIKRRRQRNTIVVVGYSGHGVFWYPVNQLDNLVFQPDLARKQQKRRERV